MPATRKNEAARTFRTFDSPQIGHATDGSSRFSVSRVSRLLSESFGEDRGARWRNLLTKVGARYEHSGS